MLTSEFWQGAILMVVAISAIYLLLHTTGHMPRTSSRMADLEGMVRLLQADNLEKMERIADLERRLSEATARIAYLEREMEQRPEHKEAPAPVVERVLLAVIGNQEELKADLTALREVENETAAGDSPIIITRCYPARFSRFAATLNRYRSDGTPIKYVHFSVHATAGRDNDICTAGVLFEDGPIGGEQLSGVLNGVEVAFVAGCDSEMLGDLLSVIPTVVTFKEKVGHSQARLATKVFWLAIGRGLQPVQAYREARSRLPAEVAEYIELHR